VCSAALACTLLTPAVARSQYHSRTDFLLAPPAVYDAGFNGFFNPAALNFLHAPELQFHLASDSLKLLEFDDWAAFAGVPHFGFGVHRQNQGSLHATDYRFSLGFGSRAHASGIAYGWSGGDELAGHERTLIASTIFRPMRYISLGFTGNFGLKTGTEEWVGELGIRPLGTSRLTLFADAAWPERARLEDIPWSAGAVVQIARGIDLAGRIYDNDAFSIGLGFNLGRFGRATQSHFDRDGNFAHQTYSSRIGGLRPSLINETIGKGKRYVPVDMRGDVDHLNFRFFDDRTLTLYDLLKNIRAASDDPRVTAIGINLSSTHIAPEHAWEIREELKRAQQAQKKVVAFIDVAGMTQYHLASVADVVVMDPEGILQLEGYTLGRTFYKGTLEKLGLGFDEWRFFRYKSAAEVLSRDSMSAADREQRQAYVDDWYELTRADVCSARGLTLQQFDALIDSQVIFLPTVALRDRLVDTLARWSDVKALMKNVTGRRLRALPAKQLMANALPPDRWGAVPRIALVYGLGPCALDEGIRARWLEGVFKKLAKDDSIHAVVFRVDSPGGDGMASDMVAEAMKECSRKKPVIVSQGQVAASGGYWISMYADTIVAGPNSVTGSIGVIGGWLYDKGVGDKLGMAYDYVQRGAHADAGHGISLPFINATIPARNLTADERTVVERTIRDAYEIFVHKVSQGRSLPPDSVRAIAEGHFYSGTDGKQLGLVDEIGGLMTALSIARVKAGLADEEIEVVEYPSHRGLFKSPALFSPLSANVREDPMIQFIRMAAEHNGRPMPLLPPGTYPAAE
jgi:protease-4